MFNIFRDSNDINEKNVVGFFSFVLMVIISIVDIVCSVKGIEFDYDKHIFDSLFYISVVSFGISELGKVIKLNK